MRADYKKFLIDPSKKIAQAVLSRDETKTDVQFLIEALKKAYPGQWAMDLADWNRVIDDLNSLEFDNGISVFTFGNSLADTLWRIPDGHLTVRNGDSTFGSLYKKHLRTPTTGNNLADLNSGEFWKLDLRQTVKGTAAILAISGFPQSSESAWDGFPEAIEKILKSKCLIVDLRGNAGGDDTKALELVSALLGYEIDMQWVRQVVCVSAEAYALQINTYERIIWNNYKIKDLSPPIKLTNHLGELKEEALKLSISPPHERKKIVEQENCSTVDAKRAKFDADIFVLTDPHTVSSGEWTCLYLKKHPRTTIVGQNTYGMVHFGNTGYLLLPNSGLAVSLCTKINEITDGSFYEKTGIPADIQISEQNSLDYVLSMIAK